MTNYNDPNWFEKHCNVSMIIWGLLSVWSALGIIWGSHTFVKVFYGVLLGFDLTMILMMKYQKSDSKFTKDNLKFMRRLIERVEEQDKMLGHAEKAVIRLTEENGQLMVENIALNNPIKKKKKRGRPKKK